MQLWSHIQDLFASSLAEHLSTPLQVEQHLTLALEEAYKVGIKPINVDLLEETLSSRIDEIEPTLIRHGYNERVIAEQFRYRPSEIRKLFSGGLEPNRAKEMKAEMKEKKRTECQHIRACILPSVLGAAFHSLRLGSSQQHVLVPLKGPIHTCSLWKCFASLLKIMFVTRV